MLPTNFEGANVVIAANQPPYYPLPVRFIGGDMGLAVSCWELTDEDLEMITRTKRIWASHLTFNHPFQPLGLSSDKPQWEGNSVPEAQCAHGVNKTEHCPGCEFEKGVEQAEREFAPHGEPVIQQEVRS